MGSIVGQTGTCVWWRVGHAKQGGNHKNKKKCICSCFTTLGYLLCLCIYTFSDAGSRIFHCRRNIYFLRNNLILPIAFSMVWMLSFFFWSVICRGWHRYGLTGTISISLFFNTLLKEKTKNIIIQIDKQKHTFSPFFCSKKKYL